MKILSILKKIRETDPTESPERQRYEATWFGATCGTFGGMFGVLAMFAWQKGWMDIAGVLALVPCAALGLMPWTRPK